MKRNLIQLDRTLALSKSTTCSLKACLGFLESVLSKLRHGQIHQLSRGRETRIPVRLPPCATHFSDVTFKSDSDISVVGSVVVAVITELY